MNAMSRSLFSIILLAWAGLYPGQAISQDFTTTITNGYVCDPKNPGGDDTRRFYREQDGLAINISPTATFPIVCPVEIPFGFPPYEITVGFTNTSPTATTRFACALEENDVFGNIVRTLGRSVTAGALQSDLIFWEDIEPLAVTNYLSIRCILPPKGAVTFLTWL